MFCGITATMVIAAGDVQFASTLRTHRTKQKRRLLGERSVLWDQDFPFTCPPFLGPIPLPRPSFCLFIFLSCITLKSTHLLASQLKSTHLHSNWLAKDDGMVWFSYSQSIWWGDSGHMSIPLYPGTRVLHMSGCCWPLRQRGQVIEVLREGRR